MKEDLFDSLCKMAGFRVVKKGEENPYLVYSLVKKQDSIHSDNSDILVSICAFV